MSKSLKILLLAISAVLLLGIFLGANLRGVHAATKEGDGAYRQMQVYGEVLRHIQTDYVEDPKMETVTKGAVRGLVETLDSNSSYLTPDEYKTYKTHVAGTGTVGLNVAKRGYYATVVSVVPNSPADKADLNDGDVIESIGDRSTRDLSIASIDLMLDGQPGSTLTMSVIRPRRAKPEKIELTRSALSFAPTAEVYYEGNSILYLKPGVVDKDHVQQIEQRLKSMSRTNSKKILLDLRDCSSGSDADGLRLANLFIKTGTLATLEGQTVTMQTFNAESGKAVNINAPMVTLVNHGTSGAAEIAAGALLDSKRSDLVGEKTFGDATELKTFDLRDGSGLILSVAKYRTPSGKKIQDDGVTPGIVVATNLQAANAAEDDEDDDDEPAPSTTPSTATVNSSKPAVPTQKAAAVVDEQLNKALEVLKAKSA